MMFSRLLLWCKDLFGGKPGLFRGLRSGHWPTVRKHHLEKEPVCQWCGSKESLEVHHISPFHIHPEDELQEHNLITLCERPGIECHLHHGHFGNWKNFNPDVRKQCARRKGKIANG